MRASIELWENVEEQLQCFICGETTIYGAAINYPPDYMRPVLIACDKCTGSFGEIAGMAVGAMEYNSEHDGVHVLQLELGFWRGLAKARDATLKKKSVELEQKLEQAEQRVKAQYSYVKPRLAELEKHFDAEAIRTKGQGYIYLMQRDNEDCKIGLSGNPDRRLKQIQREFPGVRLLHIIKTDDMPQAETTLHEEFAAKRQKGEWFRLTIENIKKITNLIRFEDGWFLQRRKEAINGQ